VILSDPTGAVQGLVELIGSLLEVDLDRYGKTVRVMHINQAIGEMAQTTDFPFDNFVDTSPTLTGTEISLASITAGRMIIRVKTIVDDTSELGAVLPDELSGDSGEAPTAFTHYGMSLFLDGDASLLSNPKITGRSKPVVLVNNTDENLWTQYLPYAVAYKACSIASVWLVEEERAIVFNQLLAEVLHGATVEYMMDVEETQSLESL